MPNFPLPPLASTTVVGLLLGSEMVERWMQDVGLAHDHDSHEHASFAYLHAYFGQTHVLWLRDYRPATLALAKKISRERRQHTLVPAELATEISTVLAEPAYVEYESWVPPAIPNQPSDGFWLHSLFTDDPAPKSQLVVSCVPTGHHELNTFQFEAEHHLSAPLLPNEHGQLLIAAFVSPPPPSLEHYLKRWLTASPTLDEEKK